MGAWCAEAELVDADDFAFWADVVVPEGCGAGFDGDAFFALGGEDAIFVVVRLSFEAFGAGHGDDAGGIAECLGCGECEVEFAAGSDDDLFEGFAFFFCDVGAFEDTVTAFLEGDIV